MTAACHSVSLFLYADTITEDVRQTEFVLCWSFCSGITVYDEVDRPWLGNRKAVTQE